MSEPQELSLKEIHAFMLQYNGRVTNHDLVKHFKKFLTNPATQGEWAIPMITSHAWRMRSVCFDLFLIGLFSEQHLLLPN